MDARTKLWIDMLIARLEELEKRVEELENK